MDTENNTYPTLQFPALELSVFSIGVNFFSPSLKNEAIIHFTHDDMEGFYKWLIKLDVMDIRNDLLEEKRTSLLSKLLWNAKGLLNE